MKKYIIQVWLFLTLALPVFTANAQSLTVDSLIQLHFEKAGGKEAWKSLNSYVLTQSGYQVSFSPRSVTDYALNDKVKETPRTTYYQYPGNYRTEWFTDGKIDFISLITTQETKLYSLFGGADPGSGMVLPDSLHLELLTFQPFHTIGPTHAIILTMEDKEMEYKGLVEAYGKECHQVLLNAKRIKNKSLLYFDAETYLIHAISNVDPPQFHKIYADYRQIDGLMIPFTKIGYKEGKLIERYTTLEIRIDEVLDGSIFLRR